MQTRIRNTWRAGLLALVLLGLAGAARAEALLERVSLTRRADGKGYVVRLHTDRQIPAADFLVDLKAPDVLQVTLRRTRLAARWRKGPPQGPVAAYTVEQRGDDVELEFRLKPAEPVYVLHYPDAASDDMLVAINFAWSRPAAAVTPDDPPRNAASSRTADLADASPGPRQDASPAEPQRVGRVRPIGWSGSRQEQNPAGDRTVEDDRADDPPPAVSENAPQQQQPPTASAATDDAPAEAAASDEAEGVHGDVWKLDRIVIDPGHGGRDPGTMHNGAREKDIALAIALRVGRAIEERLGVDVVYTRSNDRFIELDQRGKIANEAGGKLFVSIHVNALGGRNAATVHGTNTYFLGLHKSESARQVMERENAVVRLESNPEKYARFNEDDLIMQTLAQSAFLEKSEQLAGLMEREFGKRSGQHSRGVKQAGFYVLWTAAMPAVLVETGFLTHPRESTYLKSEQGQTEIAESIFRAIEAYKRVYEKGLNLSVAE